MNRTRFYVAILLASLYAVAIGYLLYVNYFFLKVAITFEENITSLAIRSIILIFLEVMQIVAIIQLVRSEGEKKRLFLFSGGLGTIYVLVYIGYRFIESLFVGRLYFSHMSVFGHLTCLILSIGSILLTRIPVGSKSLENG